VCCKTAEYEMVTETRCGTEERYWKLIIRLEASEVFKSDIIVQGDLLHQFGIEVCFKELFCPHIGK
jgi:hypothetical protein